MPDKDYQPPAHSIVVWHIADSETGDLLATETIWEDDGADAYESGPSAALLKRYGTNPDGSARDISVSVTRQDRADTMQGATPRVPLPEHLPRP
jgi:hypothetical protein